MTSLPIRSQARRATTTTYGHADTSSGYAQFKRICAAILANALRSLTRTRRDGEESKEDVAEWLWQERDCLRAFNITRIPSDYDAFIVWIYEVAERSKRNHHYLVCDDLGDRVRAGQKKARGAKEW